MILGYIARPLDKEISQSATEILFREAAHALSHARDQSRLQNKPWGVYKVVQTHHVSCPAVEVKEV